MLQIASFFGVGFLPKAPGTWASLVALPVAYLLMGVVGFPLFVVITGVTFFVGLYAIRKMQEIHGEKDLSWIVIDEIVGQWIALFPAGFGVWMGGMDAWSILWPAYVVGFLAFRFFDIKKPLLVGWADRQNEKAFYVMLDDVFAGIFAALTVLILAALYHSVLL